MSSGDESIRDIYDEVASIQDIENDQPLETIEVQEENTEANENKDSENEDQSGRRVVKPKRVVRNPQPKFNEQTLKTPKGLPAIPGHFKRVKFKGKGHEEKDLNVLMKTYEYWCHRLFPKYPFEASIARLETLGTKKATQTQLKILRSGLELDDDKKLVSDEEDMPATDGFVDQFDELLPRTQQVEREPVLSEEQLERMKQNKIRAEALRKQRLERARTAKEVNNDSAKTQNYISKSIGQVINDEVTESNKESGNKGDNTNEMDVQDNEEVDFDSILNIVNEDNPALDTPKSVDVDVREKPIENNGETKRKRIIDSSDDEIVDSQDSQKSKTNSSDCEEVQVIQNKDKTSMDEELNSTQSRKSKKNRQNIIHSDDDEYI